MSAIVTETISGIFRIRLHRPAVHNALDEELIEALHFALDRAAADRATRVVVLSGEGRSFCAGADLGWMRRQGEADPAENERSARRLALLFGKIESIERPVVARVQGAAIGGGLGLVAASDLAVASPTAVFGLSEVRLGLVPAVIGPSVLRKIGTSRSLDLILTGRRIGAAEARDIGLVHRVAADATEAGLDAALGEVVADLLRGGPEALARAKRLLREIPAFPAGGEELAARLAREIAAARAGAEGRAGTQAFLEKKEPPWAAGK